MTHPIYELVAIDLDGTLLHSATHAVSPANADAVRQTLDAGAHVLLASGRRYHTILAFARQLGLPADSPLIAYNGALVRTVGGATLSHQPLPADAARQIVRFCADGGYHLNYYLDDEWYIREETPWSRLYHERTGSVAHVTHDLTRFDGQRPTKLLLIDTPEVTDELLAHFRRHFGDALYITKTEDEYLEFMDAGVSKGEALARACAHLGVAQAQTVAFGDSYNDIPMLEWAGLAVAMSNGRPEVKAVADRVAPPADEDGVGVTLRELFPAVAA